MPTGPVVSLVNLGCPKNTVDSEHILGALVSRGFIVAAEPADAEIVLVNTCGFIEAAREESVETILQLAELKSGPEPVRALVALGCMVERYAGELANEIPEVDAWIGFADYDRIGEICERLAVPGQSSAGDSRRAQTHRHRPPRHSQPGVTGPAAGVHHDVRGNFLSAPRLRIGARHTAHLKISEGCDHPCTFCAIPKMRGRHKSRPIKWLVDEAVRLVDAGARELVLIAQDTTAYGRDLYGHFALTRLLEALLEVPGYRWLRILYTHPAHLRQDVIDLVAGAERICPYLDMPIQHIDDEMLRRMRRGTSGRHIRDLAGRLAAAERPIALRSTLIAGYPGETEAQFQNLLHFVESGVFSHLGVFAYSEEEGTPAALEERQVPGEVRARRRGQLLAAQQKVAFARLDALVGQSIEVLVDAPMDGLERRGLFVGRSVWDAPEIDGLVLLEGLGDPARGGRATRSGRATSSGQDPKTLHGPPDAVVAALQSGSFVRARVTGREDYDLIATLEENLSPAVTAPPAEEESRPMTVQGRFEV